jgi:hypothetical protein
MLMDTHCSAVDGDFLEVALLGQLGEDSLPDSLVGPTAKAPVDAVPRAELVGKVAPRGNPGLGDHP